MIVTSPVPTADVCGHDLQPVLIRQPGCDDGEIVYLADDFCLSCEVAHDKRQERRADA